MLPTINLNSGKTRVVLNAAAALAWLVLLPIGAALLYDGLTAYGYVLGASALLPLMGMYFMRPRKQKVITVATEEEKVAVEQKLQRRRIRVTWICRVLLAALVVLAIIDGGWPLAFILAGVLSERRLQTRADAFKGKKLAAFMAGSAVIMIAVAMVTRFVL